MNQVPGGGCLVWYWYHAFACKNGKNEKKKRGGVYPARYASSSICKGVREISKTWYGRHPGPSSSIPQSMVDILIDTNTCLQRRPWQLLIHTTPPLQLLRWRRRPRVTMHINLILRRRRRSLFTGSPRILGWSRRRPAMLYITCERALEGCGVCVLCV